MVESKLSSDAVCCLYSNYIFFRALDLLESCVLTVHLVLYQSVVPLRLSIPPMCRAKSCGGSLASMLGVELLRIHTERK